MAISFEAAVNDFYATLKIFEAYRDVATNIGMPFITVTTD